MTLFEFREWIKELDIQTLTDELKEEICEQVEILHSDAIDEGYQEAKSDMIQIINYNM